MIKNIFIITLILIASATSASSNEPTEGKKPPIVIEMFTSKLCPSCPPADRKLHELSKQENLIVLSCHISYFNSSTKEDDLSKDFCDIRQHGYVGSTDNLHIYTPQMIVNGKYLFIGTENDTLELALKSAQNTPIKIIKIEVEDDKIIHFSLPKSKNGTYRLWAFGYKNYGKTIVYVNTAISYTNLGAWQGNPLSQSFKKPDAPLDGIVIFAQENGYEKIIAAGKFKF